MNEQQTINAALEILESRLQRTGVVIGGSEDAANYLKLKLADRKAEVFAVLFLTTRNAVIEYREMFLGTVDKASVHPREVVRAVMETNAAAVIFAHNHPSGSADPSAADVELTRRLADVLEVIDTRVLDHIVVGGMRTASLRETGLL